MLESFIHERIELCHGILPLINEGRAQELEKMLWGGSVMLVVDHVINGELTWRFPFLTALGETGGWSVVLREMLTVGVPMSLALTLVWAVWTALKSRRVTG